MKIACFNLFFLLAFGLVPCQSRIRRVLLPVPRLIPIFSPYNQQEKTVLLVNEPRSQSSPFFPFFGGPMSSMAETGTMAVAAITLVAVVSMVNTASLTTTTTSTTTTTTPVITTSVPIETTTTPDACTPTTCLNGGDCQSIGGVSMCNCRTGFSGVNCEVTV